ncbi:hypothetical protein O4H61_11140 [Roseovarius aestuarii]|nr:hypothetical protein [Roseovarius aestuarii]
MDEQTTPNPEDETFDHEAAYYGPWAWIAGLALSVFLIVLLFSLADGIGG